MAWFPAIASNVLLAACMAAAAWFVQRRLRRPGLAGVLWVLALLKLVTPPVVRVSVLELPASMACALGACHCFQHAGTTGLVRDAAPLVLLGAWAIGAAATAAIARRRWSRFRRLMAHAAPAPRSWQRVATRVAQELALRRTPAVLAVPGRLPPLVIAGWRSARLLVPAELMGQLTSAQREALLLHELSHLKRGDHLVRWAELAVRVAFWWLPGVGWIGRQLRACEESCCDAAVAARRPHARRDYARLVLDVVDFSNPLPRPQLAPATEMSAGTGLEERVRAILDDDPPRRRAGTPTALTVGAACAILPLGLHYDFATARADAAPSAIELCDPAAAPPPSRMSAFCCPG